MILKDYRLKLDEHQRKIDRHGEFLFRERQIRKERDGDAGYLEEILEERKEKRVRLMQSLASSKGVQCGPDGESLALHTLFGHTSPLPSIQRGKAVVAGELLGSVAESPNRVPPHCHLSSLWLSTCVAEEDCQWPQLAALRPPQGFVSPLGARPRPRCSQELPDSA